MGMGQSIIVKQSLSQFTQFLHDEIEANLDNQRCPHLRHLNGFVIGPQEITYAIQPNFTNMNPIIAQTFSNQQQKDILTQLILGVYELHSNGMMGRCFNAQSIVYENNQLILLKFGYFHALSSIDELPPENIYYQMTTFDTDFWLIGLVMWKITNQNRQASIHFEGQNKAQNYQSIFRFELRNPLFNTNEISPDLVELVSSILRVYPIQRIRISDFVKNDQILLSNQKKEEICNFYLDKKKNLESLLKQFWSAEKRDSVPFKQLFYKFGDSKIWNHYSHSIMQLKLFNMAFHLCFHYSRINPIILYIGIIQSMIILSKKLIIKLIKGEIDDLCGKNASEILLDQNYLKFKEQIIDTHNQLLSKKEKICHQIRKEDQEEKVIQEKIKSSVQMIQNDQQSFTQELLLKILQSLILQQQNLAINQNNYELSFEEYFKLTIKRILGWV